MFWQLLWYLFTVNFKKKHFTFWPTGTYNFSDVIEIFQGALIFLDSLFYSHIFWSVRRLNYHLIHNENFLSMPQDLINSEKKEIICTNYSFYLNKLLSKSKSSRGNNFTEKITWLHKTLICVSLEYSGKSKAFKNIDESKSNRNSPVLELQKFENDIGRWLIKNLF